MATPSEGLSVPCKTVHVGTSSPSPSMDSATVLPGERSLPPGGSQFSTTVGGGGCGVMVAVSVGAGVAVSVGEGAAVPVGEGAAVSVGAGVTIPVGVAVLGGTEDGTTAMPPD